MNEASDPQTKRPEIWLLAAAVGVVLAAVLVGLVDAGAARGAVPLLPVVGYLAVWIPLLAVIVLAVWRFGSGSLRRDLGFGFRPLDLFWGLVVGLLARCVAVLIEVLVNGRLLSVGGPVVVSDGGPSGVWTMLAPLVWTTIASVAIAPVIEELFFRGVVLRGTAGVLAARGVSARSVRIAAVGVAGLAFALVHLIGVGSPAEAITVGCSTLVLGLGVGALAAATGRLGGAIIAHIVFNGSVFVVVWISALKPVG